MKFGLNLQSIFSETAEFKGLGRSFVWVSLKEAVSFWEYFINILLFFNATHNIW